MNKNLDLFLTFFKIGIITFGGGYAMIANIKDEVVDKKKWLENDELLEVCAIAESTPGPIAINMSTYVGYKQGKLLGSILATLGCILPSMIIIFLISLFFNTFIENKYVAYAFVGIKCGVAFLIIKSAIKLFKDIKDKKWWQYLLIALSTITMIVLDLLSINFSAILIIIIGAFLGLFFNAICKNKEVEQ